MDAALPPNAPKTPKSDVALHANTSSCHTLRTVDAPVLPDATALLDALDVPDASAPTDALALPDALV